MGEGGGVGLGAGGKDSPHTQVVCPGGLGPEGLFYAVGGYAQNPVGTQLGPGLSGLQVLLPHMDPVRSDLQGQVHIIVDDQGDLVAPAKLLQLPGLLQKSGMGEVFLPNLYHGRAPLQGLFHLVGQGFSLG